MAHPGLAVMTMLPGSSRAEMTVASGAPGHRATISAVRATLVTPGVKLVRRRVAGHLLV